MENNSPIDLNRLVIKARSKNELFEVLLLDWGIYMPYTVCSCWLCEGCCDGVD